MLSSACVIDYENNVIPLSFFPTVIVEVFGRTVGDPYAHFHAKEYLADSTDNSWRAINYLDTVSALPRASAYSY